jgi:uncharacterized protein (TIGR00369 family)
MSQVSIGKGEVNARIRGRFAGLVGVELTQVEPGEARSRLELREELMNTVGSLHAATMVAMADTTSGAGCLASLPEGASGFTTLELKVNFVGSVRRGSIRCTARLRHGGKTTQHWEAVIEDEATGKPVAFFSCTELLFYGAPET